ASPVVPAICVIKDVTNTFAGMAQKPKVSCMSGTNTKLEHDYDGINVLVTGADGFIVSHLVETLVARGANVTALAMYNSFDAHGWLDDISPNVRQAIQMIRGDI